MGLKLNVEKLDDVEEPFRPLYAEKDGKFVLAVEGYEDVAPIKKALESARKAERERQQELSKYKQLEKTPEEIQAAFERMTELEKLTDEKGKAIDIEQFKQQWLEKNQGLLTKAQKEAVEAKERLAKLENEREQDRLNGVIERAIDAVKGKRNALRPIVRQFVKIERENGQSKFIVIDENGNDRYNIGGPNDGKPMTIPELLADLAQSEDYAGNFEGSGNSGGGAKPGAGGKPAPLGIKKKSDFGGGINGAHKIDEFIKSFPTPEQGVAAYNALPD